MVTKQDFASFIAYACDRLDHADSLAQLLDSWEAQREDEESLAAIREGIADMEAGRVIPLEEAMADIRSKLGIEQ